MIKKTTVISMMLSLSFFATAVGGVSAGCNANNSTNVRVRNTNVLIAGQWSSSTNNTGGNGIFGSIGVNSITSGSVTSTNTQTIVGNTTTNNINVTGGGATNSVSVVNAGPFTSICH